MIRQTLIPAFVFLCASLGAAQQPETQTPARGVIAFVHASVIPMDSERVLPDQTVIVAKGKITALGPASTTRIPRGAIRVDATGRYLTPALSDMHVHLIGEAWNMMLPPEQRLAARDQPQDRYLFPYIANGVTTVMGLSATPEELSLRRRINDGELIGPRMILAPMIDGPDKAWPPPISTWVHSPDEARAAVHHAKAAGYDKIKAYSFLTKDEYDAIMATSKEENMGVVGHVPMELSVEYVLDAGQEMIAHTEEIAKHTSAYTPERVEYYANLIVQHHTWITPTLVTTSSILQVFDDADGLLNRPEAAYFREPLEQAVWTFISQKLYKPIPPALQQQLRDAFVKFQRPLTRALYDKGAKLLAGSDSPLPGLVPGFALHRELKELVDVGLTPYEALRTSTTAPFEYLRETDKRGTIAVGKDTDLMLLDANPLGDITAVNRISGVLVRGRWLPAAEISRRLQTLTAAR